MLSWLAVDQIKIIPGLLPPGFAHLGLPRYRAVSSCKMICRTVENNYDAKCASILISVVRTCNRSP